MRYVLHIPHTDARFTLHFTVRSFPRRSRCGGSRVRRHPSGGCAAACFERVTVSSPEAVANAVQVSRFGTYTKLANSTQGDRPVYQLVGSTVMYLFYWPNTSNWRIGSNYATSASGVRSAGSAGAACPDQATGWQAYTGSAWVSTYPITVAPEAGQTSPPTRPATASPTTVGNFAAGRGFPCVRTAGAMPSVACMQARRGASLSAQSKVYHVNASRVTTSASHTFGCSGLRRLLPDQRRRLVQPAMRWARMGAIGARQAITRSSTRRRARRRPWLPASPTAAV